MTTPPRTRPTPAQADPRSPFVFDLRELGRRAGSMREYSRRAVAPDAPEQIGLDVISVPAGAELDFDLRLESVSEGVLVTGHVHAPVIGQCGRCLEPVEDTVDVEVCELFAYADSATDETTGEDEVFRVEGDLIDVEPPIRDAVVLALPWTPLCRPDCAGLCPDCGGRLDDLPADHGHETIDPRWAALTRFAGLRDDRPSEG